MGKTVLNARRMKDQSEAEEGETKTEEEGRGGVKILKGTSRDP
jgi:hypothetical protein